MDGGFGQTALWGLATLIVLLPVYFVWMTLDTRRRRRRGERLERSWGGVAAFDEVWRPSVAEAMAVWEAEQSLPAPAPVPGDGPGVIRDGRIVIEAGRSADGSRA